jgi:type III pantothenate kinase
MVAAYDRFPGQAVMVIDAGTCMKYDVLLPEAVYTGGTIAPGIRMRLQAMHTFTDRLPLIELPDDIPLDISTITGNSTYASLLSGALEATCMEAEGMIRHYSLIFGNLTVLVTGGDGPFLASRLKNEIFAVPELVLDGLHVILGYNIKAL